VAAAVTENQAEKHTEARTQHRTESRHKVNFTTNTEQKTRLLRKDEELKGKDHQKARRITIKRPIKTE